MDRIRNLGGRMPTPPPVGPDGPNQLGSTANDNANDELPKEYHRLHQAASAGKLAIVQEIMEKECLSNGPMKVLPHRELTFAMHGAFGNGHVEVADYMLQQGVQFTHIQVEAALEREYFRVVDTMLEKGFDINSTRSQHDTLLARYLHNERVTDYLLDHGADPNAIGMFDRSALSLAIWKEPFPIVKLLLNFANATDRGQLMHYCASRLTPDCTDVADYVVAAGNKDFNTIFYKNHPASWERYQTSGLGTPLHTAVKDNNAPMVRWLLEHGADPNIPDSQHVLPLDRAKMARKTEIVEIFANVEHKS